MAGNGNRVGRAIMGGLVPVAGTLAPNVVGNALRRILAVAIDGGNGLPGARAAAAAKLQKYGDPDLAIDALVNQHISLAGAQGFLTNIGGLIATPITLPANMLGIAVVQARMVASIAHLRGYDLDDPRVRTAVAMCLVGDGLERTLGSSELPTRPLVVATAPVYDIKTDRRIADRVGADLINRVGGKQIVVAFTKRVPVVGGGVGAVYDGWSTFQVARYARAELLTRRTRRPEQQPPA